MAIRLKTVAWGPGHPRKRTSDANWKLPERWNREKWVQCSCGWRGAGIEGGDGCGACGKHATTTPTRRRVFCASLADVFDNEVDPAWRADLFSLIEKTPNLDWLLLTKRIGNVAAMMREVASHLFWIEHLDAAWLPENVWLGVTLPNRPEMLRDAQKLAAIPASVHFWSVEPMLGDLGDVPHGWLPEWVICGGESGPRARQLDRDWVRSLREQCVAAGVAFHFKQWGEWAPNWLNTDDGKEQPGSMWMDRIGKKAAGRLLDGREWNEFPRSAV